MTEFRGFDLYADPGDAALADAKAQGFAWVASYLPGAPSHSDDSWRDYPTLAASGLNVLPIWVGAQSEGPGSHDLGEAQGAAEAEECLTTLDTLAYPPGMPVVFDTENGSPLTDAQTAHLTAWRDAIAAAGDLPMVYGSYLNFDALAELFGPDNVWVFMLRDDVPDYEGVACQWKQSTSLVLAGETYTVDLDASKIAFDRPDDDGSSLQHPGAAALRRHRVIDKH
jgi:hypothetical protein